MATYHISSTRQSLFLSKQSQKSRSVLTDRSRSLGLFRKGKTCIIAKFLQTDSVICSHSRERKTLSYSWIYRVYIQVHICAKGLGIGITYIYPLQLVIIQLHTYIFNDINKNIYKALLTGKIMNIFSNTLSDNFNKVCSQILNIK